jgi:hypothetical protein
MATVQNPTGYGPRRGLIFDGYENKYELWEVKFLGYMRLQKLYNIFIPISSERELDEAKNADAFAELVQCLDDTEELGPGHTRGERQWKESPDGSERTLSRQGEAQNNLAVHGVNVVEEGRK